MRLRTVLAVLCAAPLPASAWGAQGHRIVNGAAMRALPADRHAYDVALRGAAVPTDEWGRGYLPYAIGSTRTSTRSASSGRGLIRAIRRSG